jgi:hypothetical protein
MKMSLPRQSIVYGVISTILGCSTVTKTEYVDPIVERPTHVQHLSIDEKRWPNPTGNVEPLHVITTTTLTLVGTSDGLFALMDQGLTRLDPTPVTAMCVFDENVMIARPDGLFLWSDGEMLRSPLSDAFAEFSINSLGASKEILWLGASSGLWAYQDTQLSHVINNTEVHKILADTTSDRISYEDGQGSLFALETAADLWRFLEFGMDGVTDLVPLQDTFLGVIHGQLVMRVSDDEGSIWRGISAAPDSWNPMRDVIGLTIQTNGLGAWVLTATDIIGVTGSHHRVIQRTDELWAVEMATDNQNRIWLMGETELIVYAEDPPPTLAVNWTESVEKFATANCTRCHGPIGTAMPLHTQMQWQDASAQILIELTSGRMPLDGTPTVHGDAELIRTWIAGGMQ